jgi:cytochrome c biogenesis protein CcdA/thiol-disulfide isomerase/thioredoxin
MQSLLFISFAAGALTVLAPCILPLLPVIVGGAVAGRASAARAAVIVGALGISVVLFTLLLKASAALISIPEIFWQILSGGLLFLFGVATLFPAVWDSLPGISNLYLSSNRVLGSGYQRQSLWGDALVGAALGPVFSSCSPTYFVILAAVLPANVAVGVGYLLAYALGMCLFLFVIALVGQRAVAALGVAADPRGWFKRGVGILFIIVGVAVVFGWDKTLEYSLPQGAFGEVSLEQRLLSGTQAASSSPMGSAVATSTSGSFLTLAQKSLRYPKAPELAGIAGYINTNGQPIDLSQYVGKDVVLVDFWDYSCINCQRTIPYLNAWYQKYKDEGLVIVGVHTPEFAFEQLQSNVQAAVEKAGIEYPVVLDNQYQTWSAFQNEYWPREYLIDIDGYIVHDHAGEGDYDHTEAAIQAVLAERAARLGLTGQGGAVSTSTVTIAPADLSGIESPETYFGSNRNEYLGNGVPGTAGPQSFTLPAADQIKLNTLYLGGSWTITPEYAQAQAGASVEYEYNARSVYMVATNPDGPATVSLTIDGTSAGTVTINGDRLYTVVEGATDGVHTIEIQVESGTLDAYTITFG